MSYLDFTRYVVVVLVYRKKRQCPVYESRYLMYVSHLEFALVS
jgi:hypothetical protein